MTPARLIAITQKLLTNKDEEVTIERRDLAFLLANSMMMPLWVNYVTCNHNGEIIGHEFRPKPMHSQGIWVSEGRTHSPFKVFSENKKWGETLILWPSTDAMNRI